MFHLGLIGWPLGHSLSPNLHDAALAALDLPGEYRLYPVPPLPEGQARLAELFEQVRSGDLDGLNVTIPHKQTVLPLLDELTPTAPAIGAANLIFLKDGQLIGDNTDAAGFLADLQRCGLCGPYPGPPESPGAGSRRVGPGSGVRPGQRRLAGVDSRPPGRTGQCISRQPARHWPGHPGFTTAARGPGRQLRSDRQHHPAGYVPGCRNQIPGRQTCRSRRAPACTTWCTIRLRPTSSARGAPPACAPPTGWACWSSRPPWPSRPGQASPPLWQPCGLRWRPHP